MRALFLPHPLAFDAEPPTLAGIVELGLRVLPEALTVRFTPEGQRARGPALAPYAEAWQEAGSWTVTLLGESKRHGHIVLAEETLPAYRYCGLVIA